MNMIRDNPDQEEFVFYGTHPNPQHMSLQGCDYTETEPLFEGYAYVEYCLDFCKRNKIGIFIPRLKMLEIAQHVAQFDAIGTKVMICRDIALLENMMIKDRFYQSIEGTGVVEIPDYHVVKTAEQFKAAYENLIAKGHRVCFKPTDSEGGMGFRVIDNTRNALDDLYGHVSLNISFEQAYAIFASTDEFNDIMVMELLEDIEYSIDCIATSTGRLLAAIPRRKNEGRLYLLEEVPELIEIAERVADRFQIPYAYNIQVKYNKGVPKLLEINPRMSGGLYITCLSGLNIPYLAVQSIMERNITQPMPKFGIAASYIESPIIVK
jgi:biotin carboxylase